MFVSSVCKADEHICRCKRTFWSTYFYISVDSDGREDACSCIKGVSKMCIVCELVGAGEGLCVGDTLYLSVSSHPC